MNSSSQIFTVSEITRRVKTVLETAFTDLAVQGEISNFKQHSSGHLYFTLKDENSQLQAVMWRSRANNLFFTPKDGMKIIARGKIAVYELRGIYQLDVLQLQPLGVGELQLLFEQLKQKLASEGLFSEGRKKPIPGFPEKIGIVTSPTGAAVKDIINVIGRRFPAVELILNPVKVQGPGAAAEIASAIRDFNKYGDIDVMIVGRGGGSLEDLWAFNEEIVARAIYESKIPVISAVGHDIDFTISDFVADLRAPTPSAAAEMVVPTVSEIVDIIRNFCYNGEKVIQGILSSEKERIVSLLRSHSFNRPFDLVRQYSQRLDEMKRTLTQSALHRFELAQKQAEFLQKRIASLNPRAVLERGYAIIIRGTEYVGRASKLKPRDDVQIEFHDGQVSAEIKGS